MDESSQRSNCLQNFLQLRLEGDHNDEKSCQPYPMKF
jgi:hypothetical protein